MCASCVILMRTCPIPPAVPVAWSKELSDKLYYNCSTIYVLCDAGLPFCSGFKRKMHSVSVKTHLGTAQLWDGSNLGCDMYGLLREECPYILFGVDHSSHPGKREHTNMYCRSILNYTYVICLILKRYWHIHAVVSSTSPVQSAKKTDWILQVHRSSRSSRRHRCGCPPDELGIRSPVALHRWTEPREFTEGVVVTVGGCVVWQQTIPSSFMYRIPETANG